MKTTVLTNAMLFKGKRLQKLLAVNHPNLTVQVSLDGAKPEHHDPYRGAGSWQATMDGIHLLMDNGLHVKLSTTETPANSDHLAEICQLHNSLGIPEPDHFIRPLAKRGFSEAGLPPLLQEAQ